MCTEKESEPKRLGKTKYFWKVFLRMNGTLRFIHYNYIGVSSYHVSKKAFKKRNGYQVFETKQEACAYRDRMNQYNRNFNYVDDSRYVIEKVKVDGKAMFAKGVIKRGFVFEGRPVCRVSSFSRGIN